MFFAVKISTDSLEAPNAVGWIVDKFQQSGEKKQRNDKYERTENMRSPIDIL